MNLPDAGPTCSRRWSRADPTTQRTRSLRFTVAEHSVESIADFAVGVIGSSLIPKRCGGGGVSEAGHDFFERCAVLRGEGARGVANVVEPHCLGADLRAGLGPVFREPAFAHHATLDAVVPCVVREMGEMERVVATVIENVQRSDLSRRSSRARATFRLIDMGVPPRDLAKKEPPSGA